jgi:hypothetical protein
MTIIFEPVKLKTIFKKLGIHAGRESWRLLDSD